MMTWAWVRRVILVIIPPGVFVLSWFLGAIWAWLFAMALFLVFLMILGMEIAGVWVGALVDPRNKVSLARFQTVLWTILVVSSFLVASVHNVRTNQSDPLGITIPTELWILLGVSGTRGQRQPGPSPMGGDVPQR